ncbi:MAG: zinc ABC transporter substrate-binding protein [Alkalibacterium sp.]|nr:zinc ABC transporter substrate-binding protein [Alkalibacterium sp.]
MTAKHLKMVIPMLIVGLGLAACTNEESENLSEGELSIVTSFYPVYDFTQRVAGDQADVTLMVGGGSDPHSYEPSAQDVAEINDADIFVYSSEEMEFWVPSLLDTIENDELGVVRTADGFDTDSHFDAEGDAGQETDSEVESVSDLPYDASVLGVAGHYHSGDTITLRAQHEDASEWQWYVKTSDGEWSLTEEVTDDRFEYQTTREDVFIQAVALDQEGNELAQSEAAHIHIDDHDGEDPHIWLDPVLAQDQVRMILEGLIEADPENEAYYTENAEAFISELEDLHADFDEAFRDAEDRTFVVQHQAFGYIASRYGLEQIAIGGLSTEVEPSPSRIAEINQLVEEYDVPVIYYQQGANSAIAQTVANETGTETAVLHDLESLSEELQAQDSGYIEAMRENLEALKLSIN